MFVCVLLCDIRCTVGSGIGQVVGVLFVLFCPSQTFTCGRASKQANFRFQAQASRSRHPNGRMTQPRSGGSPDGQQTFNFSLLFLSRHSRCLQTSPIDPPAPLDPPYRRPDDPTAVARFHPFKTSIRLPIATAISKHFLATSHARKSMPSWLPSIPYPPARDDGYWAPITSTLDWCEEVRPAQPTKVHDLQEKTRQSHKAQETYPFAR